MTLLHDIMIVLAQQLGKNWKVCGKRLYRTNVYGNTVTGKDLKEYRLIVIRYINLNSNWRELIGKVFYKREIFKKFAGEELSARRSWAGLLPRR